MHVIAAEELPRIPELLGCVLYRGEYVEGAQDITHTIINPILDASLDYSPCLWLSLSWILHSIQILLHLRLRSQVVMKQVEGGHHSSTSPYQARHSSNSGGITKLTKERMGKTDISLLP